MHILTGIHTFFFIMYLTDQKYQAIVQQLLRNTCYLCAISAEGEVGEYTN